MRAGPAPAPREWAPVRGGAGAGAARRRRRRRCLAPAASRLALALVAGRIVLGRRAAHLVPRRRGAAAQRQALTTKRSRRAGGAGGGRRRLRLRRLAQPPAPPPASASAAQGRRRQRQRLRWRRGGAAAVGEAAPLGALVLAERPAEIASAAAATQARLPRLQPERTTRACNPAGRPLSLHPQIRRARPRRRHTAVLSARARARRATGRGRPVADTAATFESLAPSSADARARRRRPARALSISSGGITRSVDAARLTPRKWYATCQPWTCSSASTFAAITRRAASTRHRLGVGGRRGVELLHRLEEGHRVVAKVALRLRRAFSARGVALLLPFGRARRPLLAALPPSGVSDARPACGGAAALLSLRALRFPRAASRL